MVAVQRGLSIHDLSIDEPFHGETGRSLAEKLPSEAATAEEEVEIDQVMELFRQKIAEFVPTLKELERVILEKRILSENSLTLQEIGDQ